jgi:hypothetical protein
VKGRTIVKKFVVSTLGAAGLTLAMAIPAFAGEFGPNPSGNSPRSGNCIAENSAMWIANGLDGGAETLGVGNNVSGHDNTSHGQRGAEIKAAQASCAHD